jgi:lipid-A-disaccharide synthase
MESSLVFLSAGDPSGDAASARLVSKLRVLKPSLEVFGLGGPRLRELGQRQLAEPDDLAVLGFWEVARRYRFFGALLKRCADEIRELRPCLVVLVDYPGFNLRLAQRIKSLGIPIIYYISPQIWAWGKRRLKVIRELVDLMLVILPFEKEFYAQTGVNHEFVGHYLLEEIPSGFVSSPVADALPLTLALLPGSRSQEIERMLPAMLRAAKMFNRKYSARAVVAAVTNQIDYSDYLQRYGDDTIDIVYNDSRKTIYDSHLVLTASGTATLEAAIIGRPMVVVYRTGLVTYLIARTLVRLDMIALTNLVLGEKVVPELIQSEASPSGMMAALEKYINDRKFYTGVINRLSQVPGLLVGGASQRAAELIRPYLG